MFYLLLRHPGEPVIEIRKETENADDPSTSTMDKSTDLLSPEERPLIGFKEKVMYIPTLFRFIIPLTLVYLFEYFINQGLVRQLLRFHV